MVLSRGSGVLEYWIILLRVFLAIILGGVIGLERQSKHRPAGFRTHILVCLGSSTIMILSELLIRRFSAEFGTTSDPLRMGAQVVSGIGFLGAGTIIHFGPNVKGLTTAASLWAVAAIGLAVGAGFYALAVTVTAALYLTLMIFNRISRRITVSGNTAEIHISLHNKPKTIGHINLLIAKNQGKILDMVFINPARENEDGGKDEVISIRMVLQLTYGSDVNALIHDIQNISGVLTVSNVL